MHSHFDSLGHRDHGSNYHSPWLLQNLSLLSLQPSLWDLGYPEQGRREEWTKRGREREGEREQNREGGRERERGREGEREQEGEEGRESERERGREEAKEREAVGRGMGIMYACTQERWLEGD